MENKTAVFVFDNLPPEDIAMLQALYSRSPASVNEHIVKLKAKGSGSFMSHYYVGYGHASIGDCGATTVFIEQVSMLAAKAIQDNQLYNGQEASTRYLDFTKQDVCDPLDAPTSRKIIEDWRDLYRNTLQHLLKSLSESEPFDPLNFRSEAIWKNAIAAKAFDIARGLLPLGTSTLLSWSTTLRQARDHLRRLKTHPLPEIRDIAVRIFTELLARYPHSFRNDDMAIDMSSPRTDWEIRHAQAFHSPDANSFINRYALASSEMAELASGKVVARRNAIDILGLINNELDVLHTRPKGAALPRYLAAYGNWNLLFLLDFGSFRDIQRHRNGICEIPFIDGNFGFNTWYTDQITKYLPPSAASEIKNKIAHNMTAIAGLRDALPEERRPLLQYLFPMGVNVLCHVGWSAPQMVYVGELRSEKTVHPTLRKIAHQVLDILEKDLPNIALYGNRGSDDIASKRGEQTIFEKQQNTG